MVNQDIPSQPRGLPFPFCLVDVSFGVHFHGSHKYIIFLLLDLYGNLFPPFLTSLSPPPAAHLPDLIAHVPLM